MVLFKNIKTKPHAVLMNHEIISDDIVSFTIENLYMPNLNPTGLEYYWQICRKGHCDWNTLSITEEGSLRIYVSSGINTGDMIRCVIRQGEKTKAFTRAYTFDIEEMALLRADKTKFVAENVSEVLSDFLSETSSDTADSMFSRIDSMKGKEFEKYCMELLKKNGFMDIKGTPASGDQGVDILAKKDGITYAIQCKGYSSPVGNRAVQEVYSGKSCYNCMVGVVLTNNYFTTAAKETAEKNQILLWDKDELHRLIINADD